jgi:hypothetical protein
VSTNIQHEARIKNEFPAHCQRDKIKFEIQLTAAAFLSSFKILMVFSHPFYLEDRFKNIAIYLFPHLTRRPEIKSLL